MDDDFFSCSAFFVSDNEAIHAFLQGFAMIGQCVVIFCIICLELVDEYTAHVVDTHIEMASEMVEIQRHLPVVGIRYDLKGP